MIMLNWISKTLNLGNEYKNLQVGNPNGQKDIILVGITLIPKNMVIGNRQKNAMESRSSSVVEQGFCKPQAVGSSPTSGTTL